MKKIVLASASPRRRQLLDQIGLKFEIKPSTVGETSKTNLGAKEMAMELAKLKALDVANNEINSIVIGSDTLVFMDEILGKPKDEDHAFEILQQLSGKFHYVYTGIAVIDTATDKIIVDYEQTKIKMKRLSAKEIRGYISSGEPMDKAGAYGIQGLGSVFVEKIEGCYFNVVGLPVFKLCSILDKFGVEIF